jgi:CRP-like cAMP-binding protein
MSTKFNSKKIFESIESIFPLDRNEKQAFVQILKFNRLNKLDLLLSEGDVCTNFYFISSGCFRTFQTVEGEERTVQFFFEGDWYANFESLHSGTASPEGFQSLLAGDVIFFSKNDIELVYQNHPGLEKFGRFFAERAVTNIHKRNTALISQTAEERYLALLETHPEIIEQIPQYYVASCLNLRPESLSRIKRRLQITQNKKRLT